MLARISTKWRVALVVVFALAVAAILFAIDFDHRPAPFMPFDGGMGTEASPWEISTPEQLMAIDSEDRYLAGSYVLTDDVEWSPTVPADFEGIGSADRPFTGTLDGSGHKIRGVTLRADLQRRVGLFHRSEGRIENLTLTDVDIDAPLSIGVAAVVASNHGTVSDVRVDGEIRGQANVGAVAGHNSDDAEVTKTTANGRVAGDVRVGGLVGQNFGVVKHSRTNARVDGGIRTGGLVGLNEGRIAKSEAHGGVRGTNIVGGLVGENAGDIIDSLATGSVEGQHEVGEFVGKDRPDGIQK